MNSEAKNAHRAFNKLTLWAACGLALTGAACGDANEDPGPTEELSGSVFAVTTTVFNDTNAATYVVLVGSLENQQIDLSSAPEFAGWSSVTAHDGSLFVGHGEKPEVTRYDLRDDGALVATDQPMSFADYGLSSGSLSVNTFVDGTMAHMSLDQTSRILWDPTNLTIDELIETPEIARERDGMAVQAANYQGRVVRENSVFQPFFWHDADWYQFHQQSQLGIYDRDGRLDALLDAPCPALQIATADEEGNLYFSGMVDTIAHQLVEPDNTVERCVVRVNAGEETIADGWPRRFEELTGDRPAGVFYYLKDGIGVLTVYHVENADPESDMFLETWYKDNWGLWLVDLENWEAEPITEWELGPSNVFFSKVDDRLFAHKVAADFSETTVYEVTVEGSVTERMTIPGYAAYEIERVR